MSELLLDSSETRPTRTAAAGPVRRSWTRPILIGGACAAVLAGFGVAASTVLADLIAPSKLSYRTAIGTGAASSWPDLKDGLPAVAGAPVKVTTTKTDPAPAASAPRMASLSDPMAYAAAPAAPQAAVVPSQPVPAPSRREPEAPTVRIPVPTQVTVLPPPPVTKPVPPGRLVVAVAPRPSEIVRARDETPPVAEAPPRQEAPRLREAVAPKPAAEKPTAKPTPVAAAKPAPAASAKPVAVAKATPAPDKTPKPAAAAHKPATPAPAPVRTAAAEPESDDTEILGMKIPSLAPAGRKLKDGVSALGDAVRNAF